MMRTIRAIPFLLLGLNSISFPQSKVGTVAVPFLQVGVSSRSAGLGDAMVANGAEISAIYWNPALAASLEKSQAYFNHTTWFADIDLNYGAVMLNFDDVGHVGLSFYALNSGQLEVTTEERPDGTGELFTVQDLMLGLTYSRSLTDRFNIGGTLKLIRSALWNMSASSIAADIGLTYRTPFNPITLGMSISNFGGEMRMSGTNTAVRYDPDPRVRGNNDGIIADLRTRAWDLPVTFRFGLAYQLMNTRYHKIVVNSDVLYPNNNDNYANAGIEYGLSNMFFLRGGYRQIMLDEAEGGVAFGVGFRYHNFQLDYAYTDRGRLNTPQYFSLCVSF